MPSYAFCDSAGEARCGGQQKITRWSGPGRNIRAARKLRDALIVGATLTLGLVVPRIGGAQDVEVEPKLQEVVVTAERVQTDEQRTPVSMEALTQSELTRKGIVNFQTLAQADSSVNFDTGDGGGAVITMRGLSGSQGFGGPGLVGPAVPISFDGFYYDLNFIVSESLYDVQRVEVLRGPQGTLFGRNSTGGLINVVTNDPTDQFGGYGQLTLGNYDEVDAEGALNVPISSKFQMRMAFISTQHSGYHSTYYGTDKIDDNDAKSARVKAAFEPTSHLKVLASLQVTHIGGAGLSDNVMVLPADASGFPTHVAIPLNALDTNAYNISFPSSVGIDDKLTQWRAIDDGLPWGMTLTYLGGYDSLDYLQTSPVVGVDAAAYGIPSTIELLASLDPTTQNHEIRLTSGKDQSVTWQGGLYYFRSDIGHNFTHFRDRAAPAQPDLVFFPYNDEQRSLAAYGQEDWHLGPTIFSAGLRYTRDYIARTDLASPGDGVFPARDSVQYSKWTWHLGEQWNITGHSMLYAKVDTGYSTGGFNLNVPCNCTGGPPQPTTIVPFAPEYVTSYEVGGKNQLLDNHLRVNLDAFYTRYRGQQLPGTNAGGQFTYNAKTSNIHGVEAEVTAVGTLGRMDVSASWLHATFDNQVLTNVLNQAYNIDGNQLIRAPDLSLTVSAEHAFAVSSGTLTPRVDVKFQTGQYYDFFNFPDSYQPAYTRTDVHLIYAPDAAQWSVDVYVRNIGNTTVLADESESFAPPLTQPGTYNVGFESPRTFGATFSDRF